MRPMIRLAALVPMLAFAAACSGAGAPTGPAPLTTNDPYEAVSGQATQMGNPDCRDIAVVDVSIVPAVNLTMVELTARYRFQRPGLSCAVPPRWAATRPGLIVHPKDPFRASIQHRSDVRTTVTATAPNGKVGRATF